MAKMLLVGKFFENKMEKIVSKSVQIIFLEDGGRGEKSFRVKMKKIALKKWQNNISVGNFSSEIVKIVLKK